MARHRKEVPNPDDRQYFTYSVGNAIYHLYFHPLARYPGAILSLQEVDHDLFGLLQVRPPEPHFIFQMPGPSFAGHRIRTSKPYMINMEALSE